jgi:hypothetical protein
MADVIGFICGVKYGVESVLGEFTDHLIDFTFAVDACIAKHRFLLVPVQV